MAVIKLRIYVSNIANVISLFDQIQVHRSTTGVGGAYSEITAAAAAGATLLGTETGPFDVNGETVLLKVDGGSEQTVTFTLTNPITVDNVVGEINDQTTDLTASEDGGAVRLTSDTTGTSSILEITGGTALTDLGFTNGAIDTGEDQRISLVGGTSVYEYDDQTGDADYYYKTRYYNSSTQTYSTFGDPIKGDVGSIVGSSYLILAQIDLAYLDGSPISDREVTFYNKYVPPLVVDDIGIVGREITITTDLVGHAETMLIQGSIVDVLIAGTNIVREITVPTSGTEFNVMDEIAAADDIFQIQVPDIPTAIRRS